MKAYQQKKQLSAIITLEIFLFGFDSFINFLLNQYFLQKTTKQNNSYIQQKRNKITSLNKYRVEEKKRYIFAC
jgi:hypothetical protein